MSDDRDLRMGRDIPRRDFLNGAVFAGLAGLSSAHRWLLGELGQPAAEYPPALTGLRGSIPGAFEVAHQIRDGHPDPSWASPRTIAERYDLIVVGAGISGLATAYFYRQLAGPRARILVLDNHDDFGGHARRNEFTVGGKKLLGYGGTQSLDSPSSFSATAKRVLQELGVELTRFDTAFDQRFYERHAMGPSTFFDREHFGRDQLVTRPRGLPWPEFFRRSPLPADAQAALAALYEGKIDYLAGKTPVEKKAFLAKISYRDYLLHVVKLTPIAVSYFETSTHDLYGTGIDAVPAGDCRGLGYPGFAGLGLDHEPGPGQGLTASRATEDPYIYHFPDGNATIARLLVRHLIPGSLPGLTMEDGVTGRVNYGTLDRDGGPVRIRLSSTVIRAREAKPGQVAVDYVRDGKAYRVSAPRCVLACWHGVIPHLCPELPEPQRKALKYGVKTPLLYANVALTNWRAFQQLGASFIGLPFGYWAEMALDFPVSLKGYHFSRTPDDPIVLHMLRTPCNPGLPAREQYRVGRAEMLATPFATYERKIREQLTRVLGGGGFDAAKDIAAITVNRWPHGYADEYNSLYDPVWAPGTAPHEIARKRFGRIAIANSDAAAFAFTDAAIDEAWRAVSELRGIR